MPQHVEDPTSPGSFSLTMIVRLIFLVASFVEVFGGNASALAPLALSLIPFASALGITKPGKGSAWNTKLTRTSAASSVDAPNHPHSFPSSHVHPHPHFQPGTVQDPPQEGKQTSRRQWLSLCSKVATVASLGVTSKPVASNAEVGDEGKLAPRLSGEWYDNIPVTGTAEGLSRSFFPSLTPPFQNRATFRYELGRNAWAFEQLLTFANVTATIRTNVIRLESTGGLWVHSPLYPTSEFCSLLEEIGNVEHIVLPCNAFEHKAPLAAFCRRYPRASVWIAPGQYQPLGQCGTTLSAANGNQRCRMGARIDGIFPTRDRDAHQPQSKPLSSPQQTVDPLIPRPPWADEFEYTTLYVNLPENAGPVSEVAFLHKPTKTLIATDAVAYIPKTLTKQAPIFRTYFKEEEVQEPTFWARTVLQSVFLPLRAADEGAQQTIRGGATSNNENGEVSQYPGFDAIQERLLRAPILRGFNDARAPEEARAFVDEISRWDFDRIITSHFASPIMAQPNDVRKAFAYLYSNSPSTDSVDTSFLPPITCRDWELLDNLNAIIADYKIGAPATFDYRSGCIQ